MSKLSPSVKSDLPITTDRLQSPLQSIADGEEFRTEIKKLFKINFFINQTVDNPSVPTEAATEFSALRFDEAFTSDSASASSTGALVILFSS